MLFFPRGKGPLVSVLIPSREHPEQLVGAIESCREMATNKNDIEFLIRADVDDPKTITACDRLSREFRDSVKYLIGSRGKGYMQLHDFVNQLASHATGDWLVLFNDDAEMATKGWDEIIKNCMMSSWGPNVSDVCLLRFKDQNDSHSYAFSALRRKVFEILGHYALSPMCDAWIYEVVGFTGSILNVPVYVNHNPVQWDKSRNGIELNWSLRSTEASVKKLADVEKLVRYVQNYQSKRRWTKTPTDPGWHMWRDRIGTPEYSTLCMMEAGTFIQMGSKRIEITDPDEIVMFSEKGEPSVDSIKRLGGEWAKKDV